MSEAVVKRTCAVASECGACQSIHVPYCEQLTQKQEFITSLFEGVGPKDIIRPILGMSNPYHYRNKVISPFAPGKGAKAAKGAKAPTPTRGSKGAHGRVRTEKSCGNKSTILTGMYASHSHRLIDTSGCLVENQAANRVVQAIRSIMLKHNMEPYNEDTGQGFVRHAVIRVGHTSGEMLVTIVTNGEQFASSKAFCKELKKRCPEVTTVVQNINTAATNVVLGKKQRTLYGPGFILDTLCGLSFRISSQSFYQVNALQTEVLYNTAMDFAGLDEARFVVDAYCGTATIGLVAASRSKAQVIGVDSVESAICDARQNAAHNGIKNAEFVTQDAGVFMSALAQNQAIDVLFMDPPRAGSSEEFLRAAAAANPKRIVYISCNPQTQLRDITFLQAFGYEVKAVQPVDMFPHTKHVETVCLLAK